MPMFPCFPPSKSFHSYCPETQTLAQTQAFAFYAQHKVASVKFESTVSENGHFGVTANMVSTNGVPAKGKNTFLSVGCKGNIHT